MKLNTQNQITGSPVENFLSCLESVKATGPGKYLARCSSHADKNESLSVKETENGTVLIHCWAGCSALEIVQSIGLNLSDLFPRQTSHHHEKQPYYSRQLPDYRALLKHIRPDLNVVILAAGDVARGDFNQTDMVSLANTTNRIRRVLEASNV